MTSTGTGWLQMKQRCSHTSRALAFMSSASASFGDMAPPCWCDLGLTHVMTGFKCRGPANTEMDTKNQDMARSNASAASVAAGKGGHRHVSVTVVTLASERFRVILEHVVLRSSTCRDPSTAPRVFSACLHRSENSTCPSTQHVSLISELSRLSLLSPHSRHARANLKLDQSSW